MAAENNVASIRHTDPSQESSALKSIASDVAKVLTPSEEILYIALQNMTALSIKKDCVVVTTNRLLLYRPSVLGRVDFDDFQWQDVKNVKIQQGVLSSELTVETTDGRIGTMSGLDKEQAKRLYGFTQQMEQEWREKRRIREMEEARAKSGGIYMSAPEPRAATSAEDPTQKLAQAKRMLDQGLISEAEYETVKAKILSAM